MTRDQSHGLDDKVRQEDEQAAAEIAWWAMNADRVLLVVRAMIPQRPALFSLECSLEARAKARKKLIDEAAAIVREVVDRSMDFCGDPVESDPIVAELRKIADTYMGSIQRNIEIIGDRAVGR